MQLALAIDSHQPAKRGSLDLAALKTHALKIFSALAGQIGNSKHVNEIMDKDPKVSFLFGGYCWTRKEFRLWKISHRPALSEFGADPAQWLTFSEKSGGVAFRKRKNLKGEESLGKIAFAGDQAGLAKKILIEKLNARANPLKPLDLEPFEVVRDMLRNPSHKETIGGAPQVVKVYQYMRSTTMGVYWPGKMKGKVHLQGRACLDYERVDRWVLDPDTLISECQQIAQEESLLPSEEKDGV